MCTVSMVAQDWLQRFPNYVEWTYTTPTAPEITRQEFNELKREIQAIKELLIAAKLYDTQTGQADCEDAEKIAIFKKLAELSGIDVSKVFK